jgi:hypothetical protein
MTESPLEQVFIGTIMKDNAVEQVKEDIPIQCPSPAIVFSNFYLISKSPEDDLLININGHESMVMKKERISI